MIKVAVLDDYQNAFEEIIEIEKLKNKFDFKIFNEAFNDEKEAIEIANDTPYGLAAYLQTGDTERAERVSRQLRAGGVHVNGGGYNYGSPFGGYKESGNGREGGDMGLEDYLETKALHIA